MTLLYRTRRLRALVAIVASLLSWAAFAKSANAADQQGQLNVAGSERSFSVHVPSGEPPPAGFPVVLVFHGGGMQGEGMQRLTHMNELADARGFIAVYPNGIDRHWNDGRETIKNPQDDVSFVSALIDQLERTDQVDRGRIYATGISNGALFAERLGCDLSLRIAAIAPVAGTLPTRTAAQCRPDKPVAVLQIDGTADPIMPFDGGDVSDLGGVGEGGEVLSVAQTAALWAQHNGCGARGAPQPLTSIARLDPTRIVGMQYSGCPSTGRVSVLEVVNGGHAWPGGPQFARPRVIGYASRQIDASAAISDFFLSLPAR